MPAARSRRARSFLFATGIANVVAGVGALGGVRWAWELMLVLQGLSILESAARVAAGSVGAVLGIAILGIVVGYLLSPEARAWFGMPLRR